MAVSRIGFGALFLLVSFPVIVRWGLSRGQLALALAAGHFTAVGLSGLIQAAVFPAVPRWTHGIVKRPAILVAANLP
jgi:hypothetical protein